jgi:hypothetical protein
MGAADRRVLIDAAPAVGHTVHDHARVVLYASAVHAGELAKRALVVDPAFRRHDLPFQDDLRIGRDQKVICLTLHELGRRAIETAKHLEVRSV